MKTEEFNDIFTQDALNNLFPKDRADCFFDALFGDASEGAYDISLDFMKGDKEKLRFQFDLRQRPGKCLACNLTYGLPQVFSRHPVINMKGLIRDIDDLLDGLATCNEWQFGRTLEISKTLHVIPLSVSLEESAS